MDLFLFKGSYISHIGRRSESHSAVFYAFFHDTFHIPEAFSLNTATADINQISNASGQCSVIPVSTFSAEHLSTFTIHLTSPCEFSNCLIRARFYKKRFTQKWNPVVGYSPPHLSMKRVDGRRAECSSVCLTYSTGKVEWFTQPMKTVSNKVKLMHYIPNHTIDARCTHYLIKSNAMHDPIKEMQYNTHNYVFRGV